MEENGKNINKNRKLDDLPCNSCGSDDFKVIFNRPYNAELSNNISVFVISLK